MTELRSGLFCGHRSGGMKAGVACSISRRHTVSDLPKFEPKFPKVVRQYTEVVMGSMSFVGNLVIFPPVKEL